MRHVSKTLTTAIPCCERFCRTQQLPSLLQTTCWIDQKVDLESGWKQSIIYRFVQSLSLPFDFLLTQPSFRELTKYLAVESPFGEDSGEMEDDEDGIGDRTLPTLGNEREEDKIGFTSRGEDDRSRAIVVLLARGEDEGDS